MHALMAALNASTTVSKGRHTSAIQNELLLISLTKFFTKPAPLKVLLNIIRGSSNLSLRLIDWFVTNYSKKNNIIIIKPAKGRDSEDYINVYIHYRSQLRAFSKHLFDPFRRQDKIMFHDVHTTIGQLNFFRWAIENDIITYIHAHHEVIMQDMNTMTPSQTPRKTITRKKTKIVPVVPPLEVLPSVVNLAKGRRLLRFD
jgi:hypothetical protein